MRLVSGLALMLAISACDEAAPLAVDTGGDRPQISAEQIEAERACSELTGYAPGGADAAAATAAKRQKEFRDCVAAVTGGRPQELRGRSGATPPSDS